MPVITFDFDNTIAMSQMKEHNGKIEYIFDEYNQHIVDLIHYHIQNNDEVYIVTARFEEKEQMFPEYTIEKHLERLSLKRDLWPSRVLYTNGAPKRQKLIELGTTLHYDDNMEEHVDGLTQKYVVKNPYDFYSDVRLAAKVLIFDSNDRFLLLRRTDEGRKWDIPGGHVKTIEFDRGLDGVKEGAMREVAEETALILPFLAKLGDHTFQWKGRDSEISFFMSKINETEPLVNLFMQQRQENDEYKWLSVEEAHRYAKNGTQVLRKGIEMIKNKGIITEEERFQRAMKTKHKKMKQKLIGLGNNIDTGGGEGHKKPDMSRSKSSPPGFGALGEENDKKKHKIKIKIKKSNSQNDLMREQLDEILCESEFDLSKLELKSTLHPDFWEKDNLKEKVASKLLQIAKEFENDSEIEGKVEDITITGSLASYNYHSKSDIDLHLLVDFKKLGKNAELIKNLMNLVRMKWNQTHDIIINGHEVEIYVQDSNEKHYSAGVYSLKNEKWIVKPSPETKKLNHDAIIDKASTILSEIDEISNEFKLKNYEKSKNMAEKLVEKIKKLRSSGLESDGIYSVENLAFKLLRNSGKIEILMNLRSKSYDKLMSLGEFSNIKVKIVQKVDEKRKKKRKKRRKKRKNRPKYAYYGGYLPHRSDDFGSDGGDGGGGE